VKHVWGLLVATAAAAVLLAALAATCHGGDVEGPEDYRWQNTYPDVDIKKGDLGIRCFVPFQPNKYSRPIPDPLILKVVLSNEIAKSWQIGWVHGFEKAGDRWKPRPLDNRETKNRSAVYLWWHSLAQNKMYRLDVRLHQHASGVSREQVKAKIKNDPQGVVKVVTYGVLTPDSGQEVKP